MSKRKINIEILSDSLSMKQAVRCVADVIGTVRISNNGKCFCYATAHHPQGPRRIMVFAKNNKVREGGDLISSDSFKVYYER